MTESRTDATNWCDKKSGNEKKVKTNWLRDCRVGNAPDWKRNHRCPATETTCHSCGKHGKIAKTCRHRQIKPTHVPETRKNAMDAEKTCVVKQS